MRTSIIALVVAAAVAGCAAVPAVAPPAIDLPPMTATPPAERERFWTLFDDPQLSALIDEALTANLDLRTAVARIDEARAGLRLARANLTPSLDADLGARRARSSQANAIVFPGPSITTSYSGGLQAAYEVDLWGRLAAGRDAAAASLLATRYGAEVVRTALVSQVAATYFDLLALDAELKLTRDTQLTRQDNVRLQQQRFDAGLIGEYELRLADAERAALAAATPALERAVAQTEAALALLLGRDARAVFAPVVARRAELPFATAPEVPAGLPSDLLARRPDVRQAEALLAAAQARIHEARAQYFPSLRLSARYGGESADLADLLTAPARVWSIAGGLVQPIIGTARIGAEVDGASARRQQAEYAYVQAVQAAFRDAHDALVALRSARAAQQAQDERQQQLQRALQLANARYQSGYANYIDVLDAQRNLLDAQRGLLNAARDRQVALVSVYKALGGGWDPAMLAQR